MEKVKIGHGDNDDEVAERVAIIPLLTPYKMGNFELSHR